jgi:hypothetical protein
MQAPCQFGEFALNVVKLLKKKKKVILPDK